MSRGPCPHACVMAINLQWAGSPFALCGRTTDTGGSPAFLVGGLSPLPGHCRKSLCRESCREARRLSMKASVYLSRRLSIGRHAAPGDRTMGLAQPLTGLPA